MDEDVDRAWQIEIEKRIRDLDSGVARSIPWEDVRDRLYRNTNEKQ
jgi:putative addiction module component (TIGR02574 family)